MLPPPTKLNDTSHVKLTEANPAEGSLFNPGVAVREVEPRTTFSPSVPALIDISRAIYMEMVTADPNIAKIMLPEYFYYYSTALLWLRIVSLKKKNQQEMTTPEHELFHLTQKAQFIVPEPIQMQLQHLGNIESSFQQHLYPTFPPLPTTEIQNFGGYHGILDLPGEGVDDDVHNLYEEIPCLGVLGEAVRVATGNHQPGPYASLVQFQGQQPNDNLLGFTSLGARRSEPKNLALNCRITEISFPSFPESTGFNFKFVQAISVAIQNIKTFKNITVNFLLMSELGSPSQLMIARPIPDAYSICSRGSQIITSLIGSPNHVFGAGMFYNSQLFKENSSRGSSESWCLITPTVAIPTPPEWIANRNNRRNLPEPYYYRMYTSASQQAEAFRLMTIRLMKSNG